MTIARAHAGKRKILVATKAYQVRKNMNDRPSAIA
jgi:hypothetical protein